MVERPKRFALSDTPSVAVTASPNHIHRAIEAVWRIESARLIAGLARIMRDVGLAEELAQDALVAVLERAEALGGALGPYALQAAIAACHARARTPKQTDWPRIVALYDALAQLAPSPVVELNRAVAVALAFGPAAGLELVDALASEPSLGTYHLLPSVRGDLLARLGRFAEARVELERAASLTRNAREREQQLARAAECARGAVLPPAG